MKKLLLSLALAGAVMPLPAYAQTAPMPVSSVAQKDAFTQLTAGVSKITSPGAPGTLSLFGPNAVAIVAGQSGENGRLPVVGATVAGRARVVGFSHDAYLSEQNLKVDDTGRLFDNAVMWVAGGQKPAQVGVIGNADVLQSVKSRGFAARPATSGDLSQFKVLVINGHALQAQDLAPLRAFLARGGGLVMATTGWGWDWGGTQKLNTDFVGNQLLAPFGLVWTSATADDTVSDGFKVEPLSPLLNVSNALALVKTNAVMSPADNEQAAGVLGDAMRALPPTDTTFLPQLLQLTDGVGDVVPFERKPVTIAMLRERLAATVQSQTFQTQPVEQIKPNTAGEIFPGDVPPNAKAVTKTVAIDTSIPDWHSLGLYAAPGAPLTVTLPADFDPTGYEVRIGAHTDTIWNLDSWKRFPEISRSFPLQKGETKVANAFGGLVYLVVPDDAKAGNVDVTFAGAYDSPLFVKGKTNLADWQKTVRWAPGPWAEIQTDKIIVTVPSRSVRDLADPTALCDYYDLGMNSANTLFGHSPSSRRPERIVADVQISAGYMHSGYPIMTWLDVEKKTVDVDQLKDGFWGHWHEVGHNHQRGEWTFDGTGEVTNNLLPLYMADLAQGGGPLSEATLGKAHPALATEERLKSWQKYVAGGRQFSDWQNEPFLALNMYVQMQQAFGWAPFEIVFADYEKLTDAQKPQTEQDKRDQWMVRMSRATGKNLGPFFEKWGVPTTQSARDSIKGLGAWMPKFPGE